MRGIPFSDEYDLMRNMKFIGKHGKKQGPIERSRRQKRLNVENYMVAKRARENEL